jgi:hypothetical protein
MTPFSFRDCPAFLELAKQIRAPGRKQPFAGERPRVPLGKATEQPGQCRGAMVEVRGLARRLYSSRSRLGLGARLFEVWLTVPGGGPGPVACLLEELPPGFPDGRVISEPVILRGLFLKLVAYEGSTAWLAAPLVVGKLERAPVGNALSQPRDRAEELLPRGGVARPVGSPTADWYTLEVDRSGALALDRVPVTRERLGAGLARLAEQTRRNARLVGVAIDPAGGIPAVIVLRAPGDTRCAKIMELLGEWRNCGMRWFVPEPATGRGLPSTNVMHDPLPCGQRGGGLPDELRTIPIVLCSDPDGRVGRVEVGDIALEGLRPLWRELTSMLGDRDLPFDRARIVLDPTLRFSEMAQVANFLAGLDVTDIELGLTAKEQRR